VQHDRGALLSDAELDALVAPYQRYALTESGVSPRGLPGHPKAVYATSSDEHTPESQINEEADVRQAMHSKRLRKRVGALEEMRGPSVYGPADAPTVLLCWGSTLGPVREAVDELNAAGRPTRLAHFCDLWPFPAAPAAQALAGARRVLSVEGNLTGQFAWLLRAETGIQVDGLVTRYDGRPFTVEDVLQAV
jgi:2-oxoglutarate ferredoxin oxidoreductase subunit alpha